MIMKRVVLLNSLQNNSFNYLNSNSDPDHTVGPVKINIMKKIFLLTLIIALVNLKTVHAQIPNGDFETTLSDGSLMNWGSVYLFTTIIDSSGNVIADSIVFDGMFYGPSAESHSGARALE